MAATITDSPRFPEVVARVNAEGFLQTTFNSMLLQFDGFASSANLPALIRAFEQFGLQFHPGADEGGGLDTPRFIRPKRSLAVQSDELKLLIRRGESEKAEFKSSLRYNYNIANQAPERIREPGPCNTVRDQAMKAVCGLYNSRGGDLLIGVRDDGHILGIESDFPLLKRPRPVADLRDLWRQQFIADIHDRFYEPNSLIQRISVDLLELDGSVLARITVHRGDRLAFVKYPDGSGDRLRAFVRQSVTTRELEPVSIEEYLRIRAKELEGVSRA
jgi:hypothetical protein